MRKLLLLAFGCLIALPALTQTNSDWTDYYEHWKFGKAKTTPLVLETKGYTRITLEPLDTATYIYTISRVKKVWTAPPTAYDTVWTTTEINNTSVNVKYFGPWATGTGMAKFFNGDFAFANPIAARSLTFVTTMSTPGKIELFSERFQGHGEYAIQIDSGTPVKINAGVAPFGSDKDRSKASFTSAMLPPGQHNMTLTSSAQMVVDFIRVRTYTLKPR